jgi:hypothetical protein
MYQLFGAAELAKWFLKLSGGIAVLTMLCVLAFGRPAPGGGLPLLWWFWTSLGTGATLGGAILFGLGSTGFFPKLCRLRPFRGRFPDLDGMWRGSLESNWPLVSVRLQNAPAQPPSQPVPATLRVKARLLSIHLSLETDSRYSDSETILVGVSKSGGDVPCLTYIYRNRTPSPLSTDSGIHHGAARLELRPENGVPTFRGTYWTDRNWEKGLNTAGAVVFRKVREGASAADGVGG